MNDQKLKKLFDAARAEIPATPPTGFDADVMRVIQRDVPDTTYNASLFDTLNRLFPKIALAALIIIALCCLSDFLSSSHSAGLDDDIAQLSDQWLFTTKGF